MMQTFTLLFALCAFLWTIQPPIVRGQPADPHAGHDHDTQTHDDHADDAGHGEDTHAGHDHEAQAADVPEPEADAHAGHDHGAHAADVPEPDAHAGHEDEGIALTAEQQARFGIVVETAGPGSLRNEVTLPGEVLFNEDRVVHLVPRVSGIVLEAKKTVGDRVEPGDLLAVLDSRELADAKAELLAASARAELAETTFAREQALRESLVSSEKDFLDARQALSEAQITLRSAKQKLHALGLSDDDLASLDHEHDEAITRYDVCAPIRGMVTEKHISLGESLSNSTDIFTIVDLDSVWVNLTVYAKNLAAVRAGQKVRLQMDHSEAQARGHIDMVTPFVEEATRSATARVVLDNTDGRWIPGTFVTGHIRISEDDLPVVVPLRAVQTIEGREVIFVRHADAFEMVPVTTGRADRDAVEILAGLEPGTPYVAEGAFELKATMVTSNLDSHAGHGH